MIDLKKVSEIKNVLSNKIIEKIEDTLGNIIYEVIKSFYMLKKLYGESIQNGTPTPDAPIEIESVGEYDETTGKYKIPIITNGVTTNIYLDEPLRKIGDYADYIDFENSKVIRKTEKRYCSELAWTQHQTYKNIYSVNSARFLTGINPMSPYFDSTVYQPADSIRNMTKDYCIKMHATSSALYISDSVHTTLEEFKEFISDKYIIHVLKTPEEEIIDLPEIPTVKDTKLLEVDTTIKPSDMEFIYKEN